MSPDRIISLLLWTKYEVPHQIKPRILKLTIRIGQSTICIVSICIFWPENDYYRVAVLVGQLSFDSRTYCGRSYRMQGLQQLLNLQNKKTWISLEQKKDITKRKTPFYSTLNSLLDERIFEMTYFSGRMHFKNRLVSHTCTHRGPIFNLVRGNILESVARSLFTMDEHAIVNGYLCLSFLLRIMFVKEIYF